MKELFEIETQLSPRLKWLRKYSVLTRRFPFVTPGDEDEFGNELHPWMAWIGPLDVASTRDSFRAGGNTEQEAICNLALKRGWRLWNEVGFKTHHETKRSQKNGAETSQGAHG